MVSSLNWENLAGDSTNLLGTTETLQRSYANGLN